MACLISVFRLSSCVCLLDLLVEHLVLVEEVLVTLVQNETSDTPLWKRQELGDGESSLPRGKSRPRGLSSRDPRHIGNGCAFRNRLLYMSNGHIFMSVCIIFVIVNG